LTGGAKLPVEPDPSGQGEQPLGDPDPGALDGTGAVAFQAELVSPNRSVMTGVIAIAGVAGQLRALDRLPAPAPAAPAAARQG
jgi:hypothetical protein